MTKAVMRLFGNQLKAGLLINMPRSRSGR